MSDFDKWSFLTGMGSFKIVQWIVQVPIGYIAEDSLNISNLICGVLDCP